MEEGLLFLGTLLPQVGLCVLVCRHIQGYGRQRGLHYMPCRRSGASRWLCAYVGGQGFFKHTYTRALQM